MLFVYTRHSQRCPHKDDIAWRRCRCPKWVQGIPSEEHGFIRTSAQTRTWEQVEAYAQQLESARCAKTGVPVFVPLPPLVVSSLYAIPPLSSAYFFWSGRGDARSAIQYKDTNAAFANFSALLRLKMSCSHVPRKSELLVRCEP